MSSTFSGLNTAYSALVAQRRALETTGQNVANVNTPGYTRQRANLEAQGGPAVPAMYSKYEGAGDGVKVVGVDRITDTFLQSRAQNEAAKLASQQTIATSLSRIEDVFPEPSDSALGSNLADTWNAWADVANSPGDEAPRSALLQQAQTLTGNINAASKNLSDQWSQQRDELSVTVDEVNVAAKGIAELNLAIRRDTQAGVPANELKDRRDALVDKLASLVGATGRQGEDGVVDVYLGGTAIVRGADADALRLEGPTKLADVTAASQLRIVRDKDGYPSSVSSGKAAGALETLNSTLPTYSQKLDGLASTVATSVNAIWSTGYDLDGNPAGGNFFGSSDGGPVKAANLTVLVTDPRKVAASGDAAKRLDNAVANKIAAIAGKVDGPDGVYRDLVANLAVESQTAQTRLTTQKSVSEKATDALDSVRGVDTDEEMTNLLAYQRGYEAAARVMNSINSTLDTLINMVGR
ncbi:flagellar hook-associated protein FlgK [Motilibacter deserti]|uniref:Flagellar hook-associated protein 1 n=1 Tax=Motilibacter deserti TaxID=2714956 RepID=A0ABX0GZM8_9ACTN|nr:flagellar hook-associated protein FlgK [Motilibacter deserti]NHC16267.1 flagellar hook-associated protein FlgK [Motilibacter deserti]